MEEVRSPLQGTVVRIEAAEGSTVRPGGTIVVIESMKMELDVTAPKSGTLAEIRVELGEHVARGQVLAVLESEETQ
jgi:biotin carboxyl carrier protein